MFLAFLTPFPNAIVMSAEHSVGFETLEDWVHRSLLERGPQSSVVTQHWCPCSVTVQWKVQWQLHAARAELCPWVLLITLGDSLNGGFCSSQWEIFLVLNLASGAWLPSLTKGHVAACCDWVSPLPTGLAPSLCHLTTSWECGHRDTSSHFPHSLTSWVRSSLLAPGFVWNTSSFVVKMAAFCLSFTSQS